MDVLHEYNLRKENYDYYSSCFYDEVIKGLKVYGKKELVFANKLRTLELESKVKHFKEEMEFIMRESPEYFI